MKPLQASISAETPSRLSAPLSTRNSAHLYNEVLKQSGVLSLSRLIREHLLHVLRTWIFSLRSFRGHIENQVARYPAGVPLGTALVRSPQGCLHRNIRSVARRLYIERLLATHPWCDNQDLEIFLMGFDAGEQWKSYSYGSEYDTQNGSHNSWLTPSCGDAINKQIRGAIMSA